MIGRTGPWPPDFLILGAQKCGTSSLAAALRTHPEIFLPTGEGRHFGFVDDSDINGRNFERFFAEWDGRSVVGEKTPEYLAMPRSAEQICRFLPDVKGIVMLRNPVDRAYSAYWHALRLGRTTGDFGSMIDDEISRTATVDVRKSWRHLLQRGRYAEQLQWYFDLGFDRDRMLVLFFEEVVADPPTALQAVQEFLGVDVLVTELPRRNRARRSLLPATFRRALLPFRRIRPVNALRNATNLPFVVPPMDREVRDRLFDHFGPHNERLATMLGRALPDWDFSPPS